MTAAGLRPTLGWNKKARLDGRAFFVDRIERPQSRRPNKRSRNRNKLRKSK